MEAINTESKPGSHTGIKIGSHKVNPLLAMAAVVIVVVAIAAGYIYLVPQTVGNGDTINVSYTGSFVNGTEFGSNVGGTPLQFVVGSNQIIQGFSQAVIGMSVNQQKTVTIPENEAYGPINPALFLSVPANAFSNSTIKVGEVVTDRATGERGIISAFNATNVTINFNSPLAGNTLVFTIKVLSILKG